MDGLMCSTGFRFLSFTAVQSRAKGIADNLLPLGGLFQPDSSQISKKDWEGSLPFSFAYCSSQ